MITDKSRTPRFPRYVKCILYDSASPFVRILTNRARKRILEEEQ